MFVKITSTQFVSSYFLEHFENKSIKRTTSMFFGGCNKGSVQWNLSSPYYHLKMCEIWQYFIFRHLVVFLLWRDVISYNRPTTGLIFEPIKTQKIQKQNNNPKLVLKYLNYRVKS